MQKLWKLLLAAVSLLSSCGVDERGRNTLFETISPAHSNITFRNDLQQDANFNIIEYLYFYNGGGVSIGDVNNDGLSDIFFSGNQVQNKLYLNKGNFVFEDITAQAGLEGKGNWKTGASMVDINSDGYLDIFVCGVGNYKKFDGFNQAFINNGDLTFTERTSELGLAFTGFSTHTAFLDYDRDGDLDMYLLNHSVHTQRSYSIANTREKPDSLAGDRLYKNLLTETGKTQFIDVTKESGMFSSALGYGLGVGISDLDCDGDPDLYVSNDFIENDYLYLNNGDGTFSEQVGQAMGHTSRFSMGNDLADVNNDGWVDIITLDMLPRDEAVIKTSAGEDSYEVYSYKLKYGYHKQVARNTLQVNRGRTATSGLFFSDIAPIAGVESTDWSWAPLVVDFDGDGLKDIFISNGIVRRPNDMDYISFISSDSVQRQTDVLPWIAKMPEGKVSNFIFRNRGGMSFEDRTKDWGLDLPSFSSGAAYGDLDNDGDPDLVISRINDVPLLYRNTSDGKDFLRIRLHGDQNNPFAVGSKVIVSEGTAKQVQELFPARGWCSSSDYTLLFASQHSGKPVSVQVIWPDGKTSIHEPDGLTVEISYSEQLPAYDFGLKQVPSILEPATAPAFRHVEDDFNAFARESLIPHMLTNEGPALARGDVNGDGLDDVFVGGAKGQAGSLFVQSRDGSFIAQDVPDFKKHNQCEDVSAAFFDVDGDGDLDLVVAAGGQEAFGHNELIQPRLYRNDNGSLRFSNDAFQGIYLHASCVEPMDYDGDGDVDVFIGASVMPMLYGMAPVSYLLVNDGKGKFRSDEHWLAGSQFDNPTRTRPGMVKDASWADVDGDGLVDLVLVGEWMPVTVLIQQPDHRFRNMTKEIGLAGTRGWWNAVAMQDLDHDGDVDIVAGNLGWNSRLHAAPEKPLQMYLGDFDSNGGSDHILVYYNGDSRYPFASRDALVKQLPGLKKKFLNYRDYRNVRLEDIVTPQQEGNSALMTVDDFSSTCFVNDGGRFISISLPAEAQCFPIFDINIDDVDRDSIPDLLIVGNFSATQPDFGPYDAGLGLVLKGNGDGTFSALSREVSGLEVRGEGRAIITLATGQGGKRYLIGRNNDTVLAFKFH